MRSAARLFLILRCAGQDFATGTYRVPATAAADVLKHLRHHVLTDLAGDILIDIGFFFQMKIFDNFSVVAFDIFIEFT